MNEYHKIQSLYKRDERGAMIFGEYSLPEFAYLASCPWTFTEKVDGTNVRVMWDGQAVSFNGRTDNAQMPTRLLHALIATFPASRFAGVFDDGTAACLYGEGYGSGIQKGGCYGPEQQFVLFDVKIGDFWLQREDVEDVARKLGIDVVPVIGSGTLADMERLVPTLRSTWGDFIAEGIVARPTTELRTRRGGRVVTKLKARDFPRV